MKSLNIGFGLQFLSIMVLGQAAGAHGPEGGGGAAPAHVAVMPPQAHASAPPPQMHMSAPPQQMRMSAPPQMHMSAPPQQMRVSAPQQMHMSAPRQQMRMNAPSQMHMSAPSQQMHMNSHSQEMRMNQGAMHMNGHAPSMMHEHQTAHATQHNAAAHGMHTSAQASHASSHALGHANEGTANHSSIANEHSQSHAQSANNAHLGRAALGGAALGGAALAGAHVAKASGANSAHHIVPAPSGLTNPRHIALLPHGSQPRFTSTQAKPLSWHSGATNIPRAGAKGIGRPGIVDPGGYIRTARTPSTVINPNYAQQQLASIPNYNNIFNNNNRYRNTNTAQWPWTPQSSWNTNLGYYNNYWWNGGAFPLNYFALGSFLPTSYLFDPMNGQFWAPGLGYCDQLPYGYNAPITISVEEIVPVYDAWGNLVSYRPERFNYNAFWDPNAQAYGYTDYRGQFKWVTYPGFESWLS